MKALSGLDKMGIKMNVKWKNSLGVSKKYIFFDLKHILMSAKRETIEKCLEIQKNNSRKRD